MKIFINGFWNGFIENSDPNKWFFFKYLLNLVFCENITIGNIYDSDILLESVFSEKTYINYKKWKHTIFFNGESMNYLLEKKYNRYKYIQNYDCILSGRVTNYDKKIINLPLFISYIYSNNYLHILQESKLISIVPKKNICAIISNGKSTLPRNYFLQKLETKIHIDYAGSYKNNVRRIGGAYNSDEMLRFYSEYKFIIAMENTKQETYITEKIINGFLANTIPIYWGSDNISDYFNTERFINISNMDNNTIDIAINKILFLINNNDEYLNIINKPIFSNNTLSRTIKDISDDIKNLFNK